MNVKKFSEGSGRHVLYASNNILDVTGLSMICEVFNQR